MNTQPTEQNSKFSGIYIYCVLSHFSRVQLFAILWTIVLQAPLSMGFSRQEYGSGLPCCPPGIEPVSLMSPAVTGGFFIAPATWEALAIYYL